MIWEKSWKADPRARQVADRHYNRQKPGSPQFVPPGRSMPIDPEPVFIVEEDGGRERFITDEGEVVAGRRALPEEEGPACAVGFVPHWKTCPAADRFRRR